MMLFQIYEEEMKSLELMGHNGIVGKLWGLKERSKMELEIRKVRCETCNFLASYIVTTDQPPVDVKRVSQGVQKVPLAEIDYKGIWFNGKSDKKIWLARSVDFIMIQGYSSHLVARFEAQG